MYPTHQHQKRRKKRILQGCKTVTVVRGKQGYGFTISGQNPCMLSCIVPGSPAESAGLKPGDLLYFVNGQNVSRVCHDDVVRMVGLSTGTLELQVAENCNSSDSSDDDYPPRSKSRYPNRVRPRHHIGEKTSRNDFLSRQAEIDSDLSSSLTSQEEPTWLPSALERRYEGYGHERVNHRLRTDHSSNPQSSGFTYTMMHRGIPTAQRVSSSSAVVKKVPPVTDMMKVASVPNNGHVKTKYGEEAVSGEMRRSQPTQQAQSLPTPRPSPSPLVVTEEEIEDEQLPEVAESVGAVVGYIGSIEIPSSHTRPHQRLQALRNAVRRLRVEQRVHTLVLMEVNKSGVTLTNANHQQLALYPSERIAFSGICPDDKRFFGLVTLSLPDDDGSSYMGQAENVRPPHSSCHIFMIEPDLSSHSAHVHQAEMFKISCTTNPKTRRCDEFPMSATALILCIANLYRDGPPKRFDTEIVQSQALADPIRPLERGEINSISSNSNNSNSDSGLGFGREEAPLEQNEQVCVVDMPNSDRLDTSGMSVALEESSGMSIQHHLSPQIDVTGTPRAPNSTQRPHSAFDTRRGLNNSTSSEEWQHSRFSSSKLTPRAMPDPASLQHSLSPESRPITNKGNAESLRLSMQRLLQARQQQVEEQNCMLGSDGESHAGDPVLSLSMSENGHAVLECNPVRELKGSYTNKEEDKDIFVVPTNPPPNSHYQVRSSVGRSAFQVPRPVSAPIDKLRNLQSRPEMVDMETMGKLSPRAFPHTSPTTSAFRSPSAPPAPFFPHHDSDDDDDDDDESEDDPYIRQILDQFSRDRQAALDEDSRRYSEGFALSKKREKEKHEAGNVQKWTKAGSFRRNQHAMLKQSFSQSHESLAVGDEANLSQQHKLITANSVNNIACQTGPQIYGDKGRVASWAVNFDKLLKDNVGINVFTEFLQKEFSEENIIFWKACEQYRLLKDEHQMKTQAKEIYSRFMSPKASDPVNVDSGAKTYTEKFLDNPSPIMFDVAQQQIFQLMRQDSYARFLKSDLYKNKLMDEMAGKPLESPIQEVPVVDKTDKKKVKGKENEDKRRRSILPWKQYKKSSMKSTSDPELKRFGKKSKEEKDSGSSHNVSIGSTGSTTTVTTSTNNNSNKAVTNIKKAPGPGIDLSTMRKEVFHPKEARDTPVAQFKFCRIVMPDGSTTVVCAKPGQTSRMVLSKLCEKRSISIASVDVFLLGSDRPLDLNEDISTLGSKEIVIERRVLFRLDLPNGKSIGVKAKPNRSIRDVFRPILQKYGYRMETVSVVLAGSNEFLDLDVQVAELDNHRAVVVENNGEPTWQGAEPPLSSRAQKLPSHGSRAKGEQSGSLEEITNKIFEDLMRGKSQLAHGFDEMGILELDRGKAHKNDEAHFSGLFGLLRRESVGAKDNRKSKNKSKVTFILPRTDSKKKKNSKDDEHLIEMLSSAQSKRLEDQRGVQISTGELPSFLVPPTSGGQAVEEVHLQRPLTPSMTMFDDVEAISGAGFLEKGRSNNITHRSSPGAFASTPRDNKLQTVGTPWSDKWKPRDRSFSQDGIVPSPNEAEAYFRLSPVVIDSKSGVSKSLDFSALSNSNSHNVRRMSEEMLGVDLSMGHSHLDGNLSAHFSGSQAFRPVYLSSNGTRAPVASPEKFSPENKKPRSSPVKTSPLPDKVTPPTRSSSASSSMSTQDSAPHHSPTPQPSPSPNPSPVFPQHTGHHIVTRLSDGMLLHRLQQARTEKENRHNGGHISPHKPMRPGSLEHPSTLRSKENQSPVVYKMNPQASVVDQNIDRSQGRVDLTPSQRALLSPRFEQSSQPSYPVMTSFHPSRHSEHPAHPNRVANHSPSKSTCLAQSALASTAALVSPRYNLSPVSKQYPQPVHSKDAVTSQTRVQYGLPFSQVTTRPYDADGVEEIVTFV